MAQQGRFEKQPKKRSGVAIAKRPISLTRASAVLLTIGLLLGTVILSNSPSFSIPPIFHGEIIYRGRLGSNRKVIALTIDDGPWPETTEQMLDILKQNDVKATFFWVGEALAKNPEIAKKVVAGGHSVGNHTWHHWYHSLDEAMAAAEIDRTAELIHKTTGIETFLFRPPGGYLDNGLADYALKQNYAVIMWSLTSADSDPNGTAAAFANNVLRGAKPGYIVLMHDGGGDRSKTVQALPQIIAGLKQQGYEFVTIPELLEIEMQEQGY